MVLPALRGTAPRAAKGAVPLSYLLTVPVIWGPPSPKGYPDLLSQAPPP